MKTSKHMLVCLLNSQLALVVSFYASYHRILEQNFKGDIYIFSSFFWPRKKPLKKTIRLQ